MKQLSLRIRQLAVSAALLTLAASCLNDGDTYSAGFMISRPQQPISTIYANTVIDSISFWSYGSWRLSRDAGWCTPERTSGNGSTYYNVPVSFEQNTSGSGRSVRINLQDADHPNDAYATIYIWQYATRGDGSMGTAAEVQAISGSDGSRFEFSYDSMHRPTKLRMKLNDTALRELTLRYNDNDSTLTVSDGSSMLSGRCGSDWQAMQLAGPTDTVRYASQYYSNGMPVEANIMFNLEHLHANGQNSYYAYLLGGQNLTPDSLHCADSLRIAQVKDYNTELTKLKLAYSKTDNRYQSVDVNQLIFGIEQCDPYQLLSLFRYARQTSVVSETTDGDGNGCVVEVGLNSDRSVSRMTVRRKSQGTVLTTDAPLEYTFEY